MDYAGIFLKKNHDNHSSFQAAFLKQEGAKVFIVSLETKSLPCQDTRLTGENNVKPFYKAFLSTNSKPVRITSGLSGTETFVRGLTLPLKERHKILKALPFQLESLLPFPEKSGVVCPIITPAEKNTTAITLVASTKEVIQNHLSFWRSLNIQPECVSCEPSALVRFTHWQFPREKRILSFYFSEMTLLYTVSDQGRLLFSQTFTIDEKERLPYELEKLSVYLKQKGVVTEETPWVLVNPCEEEQFPGLITQLSSVFSKNQLLLTDRQLEEYAISIGLALDLIAKDSFSVQFSQKELTPYPVRKRRNCNLLLYVAFCLIGAILTTFCGSFPLKKKKYNLINQVSEALPTSLSLTNNPSFQDIEETLLKWEKSLHQKKNPFPILPTTFTLSDVLAWVSTHPTFSTETGEKNGEITLNSLHYRLNKYPKLGESNQPYQGMLSLEFSTETPRLARDFHEALLKGDFLVNHKKEIVWQVQNHHYFTSFELNRKNSP